jgi:SSS family solute:Na+ symporter
MAMAAIDWGIIVVYMVGCIAAGVWMRRYVRDVEDFAIAGREMDLNLGIASLAATEVGIVTVMYAAEGGFKNGLAGATPGVLGFLVMLLVGITGFVIVPLRNAGVITIPELFEKRYGVRVRWLAGLVIIVGGLLNMGIFLRLGGDFLMYITGLDSRAAFELPLLGSTVRFGYLEVIMTSLLGIVLVYTVLGGMISVLVTDYLQFLVMGAGIVITSVLVVRDVGWSTLLDGLWKVYQTKATLVDTSIAGKATPVVMAHPFDPFQSYGWLWVTWQAVTQVAIMTTWQTTITRVLAARDANTAKRIYRRTSFYFVGRFLLPGMWGVGAFLYFAGQGGLASGMGSLTAMPAYLRHILGPGLLGLMIAAMLAAEMSTDSGYLLTWATVIYNDLIQPVLRRPLSEASRLLTVRLLVLAIGVFLVFYGLWYELPGRAWDYLAITGNIYLASLFTLLVGALYWRGSNSWGAIAAIILGAVGPLTFVVANIFLPKEHQIAPEIAGWAAFLLAFAGMIGGSLLGRAVGKRRLDLGAVETEPLVVEVPR